MDVSGPGFLEIVIPPLLSCIGIHNIYKAYTIGVYSNEIKNAPFISDGETISSFVKRNGTTPGFVGLSAKLTASDSSGHSVLCTRHRISELDVFLTLKREAFSTVELDHLMAERCYGRSISKLGRKIKDIIRICSPEDGLGFNSLFVEKTKTDITASSNSININYFDIVRFTEEVILAGITVTVFGHLEIDGNNISIHAPYSWYEPFVLTIKSKDELLKEMKDAIIQHRQIAGLMLGGLIVYYSWKKFIKWATEHFAYRRNRRSNAYDSVDYDSNATCVVCLENPRDVLLVDCGHAAVCNGCSGMLEQCPLCRAEIHTNPCRIFIT